MKKGLSTKQLAEKAGVNKGSINRWERDLITPRVDMAYYLAQILGVTIEYMMGWDDDAG